MPIKIYHNTSCSKSCNALSEINQVAGDGVEIVDYLTHPPTAEELTHILSLLHIKPLELIRQQEAEFGPYLNKTLTDPEYICMMIEHPILIQRPIVINGEKAIILRPPLTLADLL